MTTAINYSTWSMDDIVFDHRNKAYGAYQLRKQSEKNLRTGLIITLSSVATILLLSSFDWPFSKHTNDKPNETTLVISDPIVIDHPDLTIVQPPPPPHRPTFRYVEMMVQRNQQVTQTEPEPVMPDDKRDISTETRDGDIDAPKITEEAPANIGPPEPAQPTIFTWVEQPAEYEGGDEALMKFISDNIHYPQIDIDNDIQGKVYLKFVVMEDGAVSAVQVVRGVEATMDKEAMRVVKLLSKFHPGKQQGKPVKVYFNLPIVFKLNH